MNTEDIPDINKADKATKRYFKNSIREIQEIEMLGWRHQKIK